MAGDWIKIEHALPDKPEVMEMAAILGIDPDAVVGKLIRVWLWFDTHTDNGSAPVTVSALLNRYTCVTNFIEAMQKVGWLSIDKERLSIIGFDRHNGASAKSRANCNRRVAKLRDKKSKSVTSPLQKQLPEKRREEKNALTSKDVTASEHGSAAENENVVNHEEFAAMLDTLVTAYPRRTHYAETLKAAKSCLLRHTAEFGSVQGSYERILAGTKAIAFIVAQWTQAEQIKYVKPPHLFFEGDLWKDDPKYWISHKVLPSEELPSLGGRQASTKFTV